MTASNVAFYMAMEAQRMTEDELIQFMELTIDTYKKAKMLNRSKQEMDKLFTQMAYISNLVVIKDSKEDPTKFAERIEQTERLQQAMNTKLQ